jgi:hypothetical protein
MAIVRNPLTGQNIEATKKGKNSKGQQIWLPKDGSKRFVLDIEENNSTITTKKSKSSSKDQKNTSTVIMINGNIISELLGKKDKSEVIPYFKNHSSSISENDIRIIEKPNGVIIYSANISVGTKG